MHNQHYAYFTEAACTAIHTCYIENLLSGVLGYPALHFWLSFKDTKEISPPSPNLSLAPLMMAVKLLVWRLMSPPLLRRHASKKAARACGFFCRPDRAEPFRQWALSQPGASFTTASASLRASSSFPPFKKASDRLLRIFFRPSWSGDSSRASVYLNDKSEALG